MSNFPNIYSDDDLPDLTREIAERDLAIRTSAPRVDDLCDGETLIRTLIDHTKLAFHIPAQKKDEDDQARLGRQPLSTHGDLPRRATSPSEQE